MTLTSAALLQQIGVVSKRYSEDGDISVARQVVFKAIHDIVQDMGISRPRKDDIHTVECLFRGICQQLRGKPCDCREDGLHRCELLQQQAWRSTE
ncbi:MAG: hypothetical protein EKK46_15750 [Rhodocyclaceae bacterium]|nr:MAG: hypothetical protein EKK46_15750 [Rhodocyclaceae bacterium]